MQALKKILSRRPPDGRQEPIIYTDSVTHRMLHLLHSYPDEEFTTAQLLQAAEQPVTADAPQRPGPDAKLRDTHRSATVQLNGMLANGTAVRRQRQQEGTGRPVWVYKAGPMGPQWWALRARSPWRPEDKA